MNERKREDMTTTLEDTTIKTLEIGNYLLDIVKVEYFKGYYYSNLNNFSNTAFNSFLKAVDIPPKFFKEQPIETQEELLDNREVFVREHKKYFDKVIVVAKVKRDGSIVNACRMTESDVKSNYEKLKPIDEVSDKFEHRSFTKDGYISYVISGDIKANTDNKVLVVDFPILLNKKVVIHNALYTLPDETFATPIEHIHYLTNNEIDFAEYSNVKQAIDDKRNFLVEDLTAPEEKDILREPEVVALALYQDGVISQSYVSKVGDYIKANVKGTLTTKKLESLVLDYDETFRSYKQVTALRGVSGYSILSVLESDNFKELVEEMESTIAEFDEL